MSAELTRRCPNCGYEYESWVETCPDCGVSIESVPREPQLEVIEGGLDPNEDPRWTVVTNVPNAIMGNLLKSLLEDAGIPVLMQRSPSADIAQFSHNDYVPHDLRVPFHRLADARRVVDARPDRGIDASTWDWRGSLTTPSAFDSNAARDDQPPANLPEGWTLLPTERDVRVRQHRQRTHGEDDRWYHSDGEPNEHAESGTPPINEYGYEYDPDESPLKVDQERFSREYDPYEDDSYGGPPSWVRVIYGLLLAAISLPFIFQLLQQIATFFTFK